MDQDEQKTFVEAVQGAKDPGGKARLFDFLSLSMDRCYVFAPAGWNHLPMVSGTGTDKEKPQSFYPAFTDREHAGAVPGPAPARMTVQESFEKALRLPDCVGVVFDPWQKNAPGVSREGIAILMGIWDHRLEDPEYRYEGIEKRLVIARLAAGVQGITRQEIADFLMKLDVLCRDRSMAPGETERLLDELIVFLSQPSVRKAEFEREKKEVLSASGIRMPEIRKVPGTQLFPLYLARGPEKDRKTLIREGDWRGAYNAALREAKKQGLSEDIAACALSARQHHITGAATLLGDCMREGVVGKRDREQAVLLYREDAAKGYAPAMARLGTMEMHALQRGSYERAYHWFADGIALVDDCRCLYRMGDLYLLGRGVKRDVDRAFMLYRRALARSNEDPAEEGRAGALLRAGLCALYGVGRKKNAAAAVGYLRQAHALYVRTAGYTKRCAEKSAASALALCEAECRAQDSDVCVHEGDVCELQDGTKLTIREVVEQGRLYRASGSAPESPDRFLIRRDIAGVVSRHRDFAPAFLDLPLAGAAAADMITSGTGNPAGFTKASVRMFAVADVLSRGGNELGPEDFGKVLPLAVKAFDRLYPAAPGDGNITKTAAVLPAAFAGRNLAGTRGLALAAAKALSEDAVWVRQMEAVCSGIYLARTGHGPGEIRVYLERTFGFFQGKEELAPCENGFLAVWNTETFADSMQYVMTKGAGNERISCAVAGTLSQLSHRISDDCLEDVLVRMGNRLRQVLRRFRDICEDN